MDKNNKTDREYRPSYEKRIGRLDRQRAMFLVRETVSEACGTIRRRVRRVEGGISSKSGDH